MIEDSQVVRNQIMGGPGRLSVSVSRKEADGHGLVSFSYDPEIHIPLTLFTPKT